MSEESIGEIILFHWTSARKTKHTPSNWIAGDAVCCTHQGQSIDTRKRGGIKVEPDGSVAYSCFNCGFKATWKPGRLLSSKIKLLCQWMNIPDSVIRKMAFIALKQSSQTTLSTNTNLIPHFDQIELPPNTKKIDEHTPVSILNYILKRKLENMIDDLYYSTEPSLNHLLIIPFYYHNKLVGWSGRNTLAHTKRNRYMSQVQPGYIYGLDKQHYDNKFVLVTEGLIDSIHINGVSLLGSKANNVHVSLINNLNKHVIYIPDRDETGKKMVEKAIYEKWSVSFPKWDKHINDISDAVNEYGKLATFRSIIDSVCSSTTKIQLMKRYWFT